MKSLGIALLTVLAVNVAHADKGFDPVPGLKARKASPFKMKVIRYDGSTNGEMWVEVKNVTNKKATFDPSGLYFIPQVKPEIAPQRLGAAGPFDAHVQGTWKPAVRAPIAAGQTLKVRLQLFCIDSHRASPNSKTPFKLASKRMPAKLRKQIKNTAMRAIEGKADYKGAAAKSEIQKRVWRKRDADWVKLEGEGKQESGK